jgi:hypothetical protein
MEWGVYGLGKWAFVDFLRFVGSFSILLIAISYVLGAEGRIKQKHYQAWQVINSAHGRESSGGRIDALRDLVNDGVNLSGIDLQGAWLYKIDLGVRKQWWMRFIGRTPVPALLAAAKFDHAYLGLADLTRASLVGANLVDANLTGANLTRAYLMDADLRRADLAFADLTGANLTRAFLFQVRNWRAIKSIEHANIYGVFTPPDGFLAWAESMGAVQFKDDDEWRAYKDSVLAAESEGG